MLCTAFYWDRTSLTGYRRLRREVATWDLERLLAFGAPVSGADVRLQRVQTPDDPPPSWASTRAMDAPARVAAWMWAPSSCLTPALGEMLQTPRVRLCALYGLSRHPQAPTWLAEIIAERVLLLVERYWHITSTSDALHVDTPPWLNGKFLDADVPVSSDLWYARATLMQLSRHGRLPAAMRPRLWRLANVPHAEVRPNPWRHRAGLSVVRDQQNWARGTLVRLANPTAADWDAFVHLCATEPRWMRALAARGPRIPPTFGARVLAAEAASAAAAESQDDRYGPWAIIDPHQGGFPMERAWWTPATVEWMLASGWLASLRASIARGAHGPRAHVEWQGAPGSPPPAAGLPTSDHGLRSPRPVGWWHQARTAIQRMGSRIRDCRRRAMQPNGTQQGYPADAPLRVPRMAVVPAGPWGAALWRAATPVQAERVRAHWTPHPDDPWDPWGMSLRDLVEMASEEPILALAVVTPQDLRPWLVHPAPDCRELGIRLAAAASDARRALGVSCPEASIVEAPTSPV